MINSAYYCSVIKNKGIMETYLTVIVGIVLFVALVSIVVGAMFGSTDNDLF